MFLLFLPVLFIFSLANAQPITVECSDGKAKFELTDLLESKCLRITQAESNLSLNGIDSRSLKLFLKLSKLKDDKLFAFIDSLTPDQFRIIDYHAKYLRVYHELDALFKYKYLKEYSLNGGRKEMLDFVHAKFFPFKFINARWQVINLFDIYCSQSRIPENSFSHDERAFFVLLDFYQQIMKKPLKLSTQHLKNIFYSFDSAIQNELLKKQLVII